MSDITPEKVAGLMAEWEAVYDESSNCWLGIESVEGNVARLLFEPAKITPFGEKPDAAKHFRAVVVEVPAHAVASEPVKLPADLARELACGDPGDSMEGYTVVANEYIEKRRWDSVHWLVIRNEAGQHFADTYSRGLTEYQDNGPYEYEKTATFTPVAPAFKVATEWKFAKAQSGGAS